MGVRVCISVLVHLCMGAVIFGLDGSCCEVKSGMDVAMDVAVDMDIDML